MNELELLGLKYKTDKIGKHHYLPVYYKMFKDRKDRVSKVLEIGFAEGAGVRMLRDFFTKAEIFGADIEDKRVSRMIKHPEERIYVYTCDQSNLYSLYGMLDNTGIGFDLIVDDGSHIPAHQIFTCRALMPTLCKHGVYVIEDVADEGIVKYLSDFSVEILRVGERYDDRLVIVKNK